MISVDYNLSPSKSLRCPPFISPFNLWKNAKSHSITSLVLDFNTATSDIVHYHFSAFTALSVLFIHQRMQKRLLLLLG